MPLTIFIEKLKKKLIHNSLVYNNNFLIIEIIQKFKNSFCKITCFQISSIQIISVAVVLLIIEK